MSTSQLLLSATKKFIFPFIMRFVLWASVSIDLHASVIKLSLMVFSLYFGSLSLYCKGTRLYVICSLFFAATTAGVSLLFPLFCRQSLADDGRQFISIRDKCLNKLFFVCILSNERCQHMRQRHTTIPNDKNSIEFDLGRGTYKVKLVCSCRQLIVFDRLFHSAPM